MLQAILDSLPSFIQTVPFLPELIKPALTAALKMALKQVKPEQLSNMQALFEYWLDAVGRRDYAAIAILYETAHVPPGGLLEQFTARIMGLTFQTTVMNGATPVEGYGLPAQDATVEATNGHSDRAE